LAGGPIGKLRDGDVIKIVIDTKTLAASVDFVGEGDRRFSREEGAEILAGRKTREDLRADPRLPDDTKLWAALQQASGGAWGGCVYDAAEIVRRIAP
jgi:dihydroxyacid dehydratase/phosphogluconate dehydratase